MILCRPYKIDPKPTGNKKRDLANIPLEIKKHFPELISRTCTICDQTLLFRENLTNHIEDNHPNEYRSCPDRKRPRKKKRRSYIQKRRGAKEV